jgi:hypothetical protein
LYLDHHRYRCKSWVTWQWKGAAPPARYWALLASNSAHVKSSRAGAEARFRPREGKEGLGEFNFTVKVDIQVHGHKRRVETAGASSQQDNGVPLFTPASCQLDLRTSTLRSETNIVQRGLLCHCPCRWAKAEQIRSDQNRATFPRQSCKLLSARVLKRPFYNYSINLSYPLLKADLQLDKVGDKVGANLASLGSCRELGAIGGVATVAAMYRTAPYRTVPHRTLRTGRWYLPYCSRPGSRCARASRPVTVDTPILRSVLGQCVRVLVALPARMRGGL